MITDEQAIQAARALFNRQYQPGTAAHKVQALTAHNLHAVMQDIAHALELAELADQDGYWPFTDFKPGPTTPEIHNQPHPFEVDQPHTQTTTTSTNTHPHRRQ